MQLGVVSVQREYLELTGLLQYMTKYKPSMEGIKDLNAHTTYPSNCIGCFTQDPRIAQAFWHACLPCWFLRPLQAFSDENILRVVAPFAVADFLEMNPAARFSPNMPWYRNLFAAASPNIASTSLAGSPDVASTSVAGTLVSGTFRGRRAEVPSWKVSVSGSPYAAPQAQAKAKKEAQGPNPNAKVAHDKFLPFQCPEMPTPITPWANALKAIDRGRPPSCGIDLPQRYVLPEPALVASPDEEPHRHMFYHHYRLLHDTLMFRLADPNVPPTLLSTQQWRDVLQGKVVKQGKTGTHTQARSMGLEELLRPAFQACGIDVLTEFPVPLEAVPTMCMHTVKELLWELAEINFRYEFLALDVHASGLDRPDECRRCFAGEGLIGLDFHESQRGLAALGEMDRLPYLLCTAGLMCDWSVPCTRPKEINTAKERTESEWDCSTVRQLEQKVTQYYTQGFYELFGQAAVVSMRLEHEIGS
ncbi:hypothetical protein B0H10DRAFT_2230838 [Mycena sp. CBHHK59/15]|nr:hypothetical protein B0H10DRAFT_2230838 [Mycena sp. CBHHK59/15]